MFFFVSQSLLLADTTIHIRLYMCLCVSVCLAQNRSLDSTFIGRGLIAVTGRAHCQRQVAFLELALARAATGMLDILKSIFRLQLELKELSKFLFGNQGILEWPYNKNYFICY